MFLLNYSNLYIHHDSNNKNIYLQTTRVNIGLMYINPELGEA